MYTIPTKLYLWTFQNLFTKLKMYGFWNMYTFMIYPLFFFNLAMAQTKLEYLLKTAKYSANVTPIWLLSLTIGVSLGIRMTLRGGDRGGDEWRVAASATSRCTLSWSCKSRCARRAVTYKPAQKKAVTSPNTPAAENRPCLMVRQVGLGVDQSLRCPDSTLRPTNNKISPTEKQILK